MRACEGQCERVSIYRTNLQISNARIFFGLFFVYLPALAFPIILASAGLVYVHLRLMGAQGVKTLRDFLPAWQSHRYRFKSQIVRQDPPKLDLWSRTRLFWMLNCTAYCPFSVALLEWHAYLVKIVQNWWCPFEHSQKHRYAEAAIDYSYWHNELDITHLHSADRDNPIWNQDAEPAAAPRVMPAAKAVGE